MSSLRPVRHRAFLVPGYYDGYLGKQETKSQDMNDAAKPETYCPSVIPTEKYKRYWTVLRGNELFFQMTSRDPTYIEKISLDNFVSVENDDSRNNNQQNTFILKLKSGHTKLEADSSEAREQWKGFIHTVAKLEVPNLDFLPGQIHRLQEVCEAETKRRQKPASSPPALPPPRSRPSTPEFAENDYDDVENNLPSCFYEVTRLEAEALLEKNVEHGNMLMRPSSNNKNLSITTRQVFKNNSIIKHYRISSTDNGYIIEVDDGIPCSSRQEVINFFIQHTQGVLKPLEIPADYEINLSYVQEDAESGELIHQKLHTLKLSPTKTSTQPVNKEKWSPKIPKNIEPEPDYLNDNEIPKELLPARPKIQQPARPSQSNTLPGLTYAVNKELQLKLHQRRAAMCD